MYTTISDVRKSLKGIDSVVVPDNSEAEFSVTHAITKADRIIDANLTETFTITEPVPDLVAELSTELAVSLVRVLVYLTPGMIKKRRLETLYNYVFLILGINITITYTLMV